MIIKVRKFNRDSFKIIRCPKQPNITEGQLYELVYDSDVIEPEDIEHVMDLAREALHKMIKRWIKKGLDIFDVMVLDYALRDHMLVEEYVEKEYKGWRSYGEK